MEKIENNKKVIIGIDFGISGIGFTYGFLGIRIKKQFQDILKDKI
jgi:hypothetical protein